MRLLPEKAVSLRLGALVAALLGMVWIASREGGCAWAAPVWDQPFRLLPVGNVRQPTAMVALSDELFVTSQIGEILALNTETGALRSVLKLTDISSGGEAGLLGLAVGPRWPTDPRAFINYTDLHGTKGLSTVIASFDLPTSGPASLTTLRPILRFDQPYSNHNSGSLAFGPDGMLYAAVGDGGSGGDPQGHGQNTGDWLGSILRLDVSGAAGTYAVPTDNPFVGRAGFLPEIWAYGVRNPWGMHFDRGGDHAMYFGDVGQSRYEEVNRGVSGGNYGWNRMEGTHGFPSGEPGPGDTVPPLAQYGRNLGVSVTGGVVCRDPQLPGLEGMYLFADFGSGRFFGWKDGVMSDLGVADMNPSTFTDDAAGRVYVADYQGTIFRMRGR